MGIRKTPSGLRALVEEYEKGLIVEALERCRGNQRRAASALGVSPTCLNEKLKRLQIRVVHEIVEAPRPDDQERERVLAALAGAGGQLHRAAAALQLSPGVLREKLGLLQVQLMARIVVEPG